MPRDLSIDDDVFAALQEQAEPLVDDANSVLRRVLGITPAATALTTPVVPLRPAPTSVDSGVREKRSRTSRKKTARTKGRSRAARGTVLPETAYELPVLRALQEQGGRAPATEVIERVGELLAGQFLPADHEKVSSGLVRWKNKVQFARLTLVKSGDMVKDSPRGLWEITDQGRRRVDSAAGSEGVG